MNCFFVSIFCVLFMVGISFFLNFLLQTSLTYSMYFYFVNLPCDLLPKMYNSTNMVEQCNSL